MPHVIAHAMTSHMHCMAHAHRQASHPYDFMPCQKLIVCLPFMPAEQLLLKISASHFNALNMQIANQNVLERILITMQDNNKANCNENFRICSEESIGCLYKWQASLGLYGLSYINYKFCSGPFWTHKLQPKLKYNSISNILHLLNAPDSVPHAELVLASLGVESKSHCKFFLSVIFCLIVDSCVHPSRALTRRFVCLLVYLG